MNHLLPGLVIIFFLISCFFIKNKFINYKLIFLPILSTSILLIISYILQDNWIWDNSDIRNYLVLEKIFKKYKNKIKVIIHAAAQPSHDWAKKNHLLIFI